MRQLFYCKIRWKLTKKSKFITKCDRFITKCDRFITKCDRFITKCDRFITECDRFVTKWISYVDNVYFRTKRIGKQGLLIGAWFLNQKTTLLGPEQLTVSDTQFLKRQTLISVSKWNKYSIVRKKFGKGTQSPKESLKRKYFEQEMPR